MKRKQSATLPFGEWLPDLPEFGNPGLTVASGVIPDAVTYRPLKSPDVATISSAIASRPRGYSGAVGAGHQTYLYVGDDTALYSLVAEVFTDASKAGGYSMADDSLWEFAQFGETFVATNFDDAVQSITPGSAAFADMITSTNRPKARHVGVVGQFLVLGHTNDGTDGVKRSRVWWSAIRDQTDFDPDSATQCDYEDLKDGGDVQRIVGGVEYGLVFCERAIYRMTYVGPPLVFRFDPIDRKRGTPVPGSVVSLGRSVYFLSEEGFFVTDGVNSRSIGENKVDRTFWKQFLLSQRTRVTAAVDPVNKLIVWAFPSTEVDENVYGVEPCRLYFYHWPSGRWSSHDTANVVMVGNNLTLGLTLEEVAELYPDLEGVPFSLDAISWTGGDRLLTTFVSSQQVLATVFRYSDSISTAKSAISNREAVLTTGKIELNKGHRTVVNRARALTDASSPTVAIAGYEDLAESDSFDSAAATNNIGDTSQRNDGRYHKITTTIPQGASWEHAQGVEVECFRKGRR